MGLKLSRSKQNETFVEAARALECDESENRFNATLGKIVRHKPKPEAPPEKTETPDEKEPAK
jgi:hypothetical protein